MRAERIGGSLVGIVVVSHSAKLAEGVVELARQMGGGDVVEGKASPPAPALEPSLVASTVHQDPPHGFRGRAEKVPPSLPGHRPGSHEPQIGFVDQGRRIECLSRRLVLQATGGQSTEFVVNQRQQLLRRRGIAALERFDNF